MAAPQGSRDKSEKDWRELHLWQIQPVRDALVIAAVIGLVALGYLLSIVTVPILLAMALAYLFEPLVRWAARRIGVGRPVAALAIIASAAVILIVPATIGTGFAVLQGISYTRTVIANVQALQRSVDEPDDPSLKDALPPGGWRTIRDYVVEAKQREQDGFVREDGGMPRGLVRETAAWAFGLLHANAEAIGKFVGRQAVGTGADAARAALGFIKHFGILIFGGFLTAFFFYFFCTGYGRVLQFWESLIPTQRRERVISLLRQMDRVIAAFIRGRLIICAVLMAYYAAAYSLVGVPTPLILGLIVGALSVLPYVSALGIPAAMLLMWLQPAGGWQGEWWWILGGPIIAAVGAQVIDDYFLTPRIQGKGTGMDMPTVVFASIAGGVLAGAYGLLLAIPVAACLKILIREVAWPRFRDWAEGRSSDPLPIGDGDRHS